MSHIKQSLFTEELKHNNINFTISRIMNMIAWYAIIDNKTYGNYIDMETYFTDGVDADECYVLLLDQAKRTIDSVLNLNEDGKIIEEVKHEDGRQDVNIKVNRLNLENRTEEDNVAEKKIIEALSKKQVLVIIIDKKSNDFAQFMSPLPEVRSRAENVIATRKDDVNDYLIIEVEEDKTVRISQL